MVTHDSDAAQRATRQIRLERGKLVEQGNQIVPRALRSA
jgi:predicted ABC-type transport system involved in lysophospholipase L1 biosynthesis ATPase subunit